MANTTDTKQDTLAKERGQLSSQDIAKHLKDGEEPTPILLSLVSSPLIDLKLRGLVRIFKFKEDGSGRPAVAVLIYDTEWVEGKGIVEKQSVGKSETPS